MESSLLQKLITEILNEHTGEDASIRSDHNSLEIELPEVIYYLDTLGNIRKEGKPQAPAISWDGIGKRFPEELYGAIEKLLMKSRRVTLEPAEILSGPDLWDAAEDERNYLPLGFTEPAGNLPFEWASSFEDYFKFGLDDKGKLYVDVSYIPLRPMLWDFEKSDEAREWFRSTALSELLTEEEFLHDLYEEERWIVECLPQSEIYELVFEVIEEPDAETVTESVDYPLRNKRFPVHLGDKHYSVYVHLHQD